MRLASLAVPSRDAHGAGGIHVACGFMGCRVGFGAPGPGLGSAGPSLAARHPHRGTEHDRDRTRVLKPLSFTDRQAPGRAWLRRIQSSRESGVLRQPRRRLAGSGDGCTTGRTIVFRLASHPASRSYLCPTGAPGLIRADAPNGSRPRSSHDSGVPAAVPPSTCSPLRTFRAEESRPGDPGEKRPIGVAR